MRCALVLVACLVWPSSRTFGEARRTSRHVPRSLLFFQYHVFRIVRSQCANRESKTRHERPQHSVPPPLPGTAFAFVLRPKDDLSSSLLSRPSMSGRLTAHRNSAFLLKWLTDKCSASNCGCSVAGPLRSRRKARRTRALTRARTYLSQAQRPQHFPKSVRFFSASFMSELI